LRLYASDKVKALIMQVIRASMMFLHNMGLTFP
jgi:hypothetical protein